MLLFSFLATTIDTRNNWLTTRARHLLVESRHCARTQTEMLFCVALGSRNLYYHVRLDLLTRSRQVRCVFPPEIGLSAPVSFPFSLYISILLLLVRIGYELRQLFATSVSVSAYILLLYICNGNGGILGELLSNVILPVMQSSFYSPLSLIFNY